MKRHFHIIFLTVGVMILFAACKKDYVTLTLKTQDYSSQDKTHIADANGVHYTCWDNNDQIMVNGTTTNVTNSTISVPTSSDGYFAVYPASCVNDPSVTSSTQITLPAVYTWIESNGVQQLQAPMAAKAVTGDHGNVLFFKNLCTLLKVHLTNNITVHNINIHSKNANLSGTATVTIRDGGDVTMAAVSGEKHVSLYFPNGYTTTGNGKDFYIPVPELATGETLYVSVVATVGGNKGVYLRGVPVNTGGLPANLLVSLNIFPTIGQYKVASIVSYLQGRRTSSGGGMYRPYINSRVIPNENTTIITSITTEGSNANAPSSYKEQFIYGVNVDAQSIPTMFYLWKKPEGSSTDLVQTGTARPDNVASFEENSETQITITHAPSGLTVNGTTYPTSSSWNTSSDNDIWIFGANNDSRSRHFMGRMYYFRIQDNSGWRFYGEPVIVEVAKWDQANMKYLRNGYGAISGNVPCMYDYVSGEFFSTEMATGSGDSLSPVHFGYPH
jgi:hypothetical protein